MTQDWNEITTAYHQETGDAYVLSEETGYEHVPGIIRVTRHDPTEETDAAVLLELKYKGAANRNAAIDLAIELIAAETGDAFIIADNTRLEGDGEASEDAPTPHIDRLPYAEAALRMIAYNRALRLLGRHDELLNYGMPIHSVMSTINEGHAPMITAPHYAVQCGFGLSFHAAEEDARAFLAEHHTAGEEKALIRFEWARIPGPLAHYEMVYTSLL